jgi:AraC-like DNA-binding protein
MNSDSMHMLLALPVATAGVMLATAAGMLRTERATVRWTGVAFMLSVAAYALKLWNDELHVLPDALVLVREVIGAGAVGWFLLFVTAVFEDEPRLHPGMLTAVVALILFCVIGAYGAPWSRWTDVLANLMRIAMALAALAVVVRGWRGDLVEPRRRLRGPLLVTITAYILVTRCLAVLNNLGMAPGWYLATNAAILFLIANAASLVFLESRGAIFSAAPMRAGARSPSQRVIAETACRDRAMQADLGRVQMLMETQQAWREEGLTIASLAVRVNMPEAQLRRLINDQLGYRNFPGFVNAHRIAEAKARLADPGEARTTVSAIAFDIGFGSLGPFNRAFRQETGLSPSEWRRKALGSAVEDNPTDAVESA